MLHSTPIHVIPVDKEQNYEGQTQLRARLSTLHSINIRVHNLQHCISMTPFRKVKENIPSCKETNGINSYSTCLNHAILSTHMCVHITATHTHTHTQTTHTILAWHIHKATTIYIPHSPTHAFFFAHFFLEGGMG